MILEGKVEATEFLEKAGARFLDVTEHVAKFAGSRPLHPEDGWHAAPLAVLHLMRLCLQVQSSKRLGSQASASGLTTPPCWARLATRFAGCNGADAEAR